MWFRNYYYCPGDLDWRFKHEPVEWQDEWDCECDDRCPECGTEMTPYKSEPIGVEQDG